VSIGNENWGPIYEERYARFYDAIKARYPQIQLIATAPVKSRPIDILDEHYYSTPEWFILNANLYDRYDRKGPKILVGEYAVTAKCGTGNLRAAIAEAAFMTGIERNADVVVMAAYAPLFVNVNDRAWNPDLIGFDSARCYGTPSYYVQHLFSVYRGTHTLPTRVQSPNALTDAARGAVGLGTWETQAEFRNLKVVSVQGETLLAAGLCARRGGLAHHARRVAGDGGRLPTDGTRARLPRSGGRPQLDRLHDYPTGAQTRRRRGVPHHVPRARRPELVLVEHRRLGQHAPRR
jgi:hypothetical protein